MSEQQEAMQVYYDSYVQIHSVAEEKADRSQYRSTRQKNSREQRLVE